MSRRSHERTVSIFAKAGTLQLALVLSACSGDSGPTQPAPVNQPSVSRIELNLPSEPIRLMGNATARPLDASGTLLPGVRVSWQVADPSIGEVTTNDLSTRSVTISARDGGHTEIRASAQGVTASGEVELQVRVDGTVHTLDGLSPSGLQASISVASESDSASVALDGRFTLWTDLPIASQSISLLIDRSDGGPREYLPTLLQDTTLGPTSDITALLLPTRWTIQGGRFAGLETPVSAQRLLSFPNSDDRGNLYQRLVEHQLIFRAVQRRHASRPVTRSIAWPASRMPIPVFFDRTGSNPTFGLGPRQPITASDSTVFWQAMDELEARLGMDVIRPALKQDMAFDTIVVGSNTFLRPIYAIRVDVFPTLDSIGALGLGGAGDACLFNTAIGNFECDPRFPLEDFVVGEAHFSDNRSSIRSAHVTQHEMLHALGFGHACYPSVVANCAASGNPTFGGLAEYPFQNLPTFLNDGLATEYDVTAVQLYFAVHRKTLELAPNMGFLEAVSGERLRMLGLPPLPVWYLGLGTPPASARGSVLGGGIGRVPVDLLP